eukprot:c52446_g1_i1.p1 GENE.c52446_g1_i1~~c52446_g1_i1.p1  ORF type:complete len:303 (+),score=19.53 c52446_g1_i1:69-911(+)
MEPGQAADPSAPRSSVVSIESTPQQRPQEKKARKCSVVMNLTLWILLFGSFVLGGLRTGTPAAVFILACFVWYLAYLFVACSSGTNKFLLSPVHRTQVVETTNLMKANAPSIGFHVLCSHMELRTGTRTVPDGNGNTRVELYTYQEQVISYQAFPTFSYSTWSDESDSFDDLSHGVGTTKLYLHLRWIADEPTRAAYESLRAELWSQHRHRDTTVSITDTFTVPGFQERLLVHDGNRPLLMGCGWYWLAVIFCMDLPYRLYLDSLVSSSVEKTIWKRISK